MKISNISFMAECKVYGKDNPKQTEQAYTEKIAELQRRRLIATQMQECIQKNEEIADQIKSLPSDTFVRLYTGVDSNKDGNTELLDIEPFIIFNTSIREDAALSNGSTQDVPLDSVSCIFRPTLGNDKTINQQVTEWLTRLGQKIALIRSTQKNDN
ncbi:MAG: hypothetical protein IKU37_06125 [Candidatus Gastranaerophilales bacterium]|nr:hypothetical protein [Candidatus Gastranaerophilales bacterium]